MVAGASEVSGPVGGGACDGVQCPHHDICHVVDQSPRCICRARCHDNDNDDNFSVVVRQSRRRRSSNFVTHRGHVEARSVTCALVDAAENKFRRGDFSTRRAENAVDWSTWMCCCNNDDDDEKNNDNKNDDTSDNNEKNNHDDDGDDEKTTKTTRTSTTTTTNNNDNNNEKNDDDDDDDQGAGVCGTDGVTYRSACSLHLLACRRQSSVQVAYYAPCAGQLIADLYSHVVPCERRLVD